MKNKILDTIEFDWQTAKWVRTPEMKRHSKSHIEKLKKSLIKNGIVSPFHIWVTGKKTYILDGHTRQRVMGELKEEGMKIPNLMPGNVIQCKNMVEAKELVLIYDSSYGKIVQSAFDIFVEDIKIEDIEDTVNIEGIKLDNNGFIEDEPPNKPKKAKSKTGDFYELEHDGVKHRVICGDSTDENTIKILMLGHKLDMVFTDPPYGVSIGDKNKLLDTVKKSGRITHNIENDTLSPDKLEELLVGAFVLIKKHSNSVCSYYVTAPQGGDLGMMMLGMMKKAGLPVRHIIIWVKNSQTFSFGRLDYEYKHEPIFYTWNKSHMFYGNGSAKSSVWNFDKENKCDIHPTMKPVKLVANAILNSTEKDMFVGDIFLGSGTTLIACQQTGRNCLGVELDPKYVDVIIQRWVNFTQCIKIKKNGKEIKWENISKKKNEKT